MEPDENEKPPEANTVESQPFATSWRPDPEVKPEPEADEEDAE